MTFIISLVALVLVVAALNKFFVKGDTDCFALENQGHTICEHDGIHN